MAKEPSVDGDESEDMESFQELYESSLVNIQEGEVIHGKIVQITDDFVMVDIGYKSEGQIRIDEFRDENGIIQAAVGDEVDALLEYREDDDGTILLSKEKALKIKIWDDISQIYNDDGIIEGMVVSKVKGGLAVDIGIQAFLPGSQVDLRPVRNLESLINQILPVQDPQVQQEASQRGAFPPGPARKRTRPSEGPDSGRSGRRQGHRRNRQEHHRLRRVCGSWRYRRLAAHHRHELGAGGASVGNVPDRRKDPGQGAAVRPQQRTGLPGLEAVGGRSVDHGLRKNIRIGTRVKGRVVSLTDYGAFVEIEEGVEGLIHVSEMSWTQKIRHPSKILSVGDKVEAVVLDINVDNKRISLGMKQIEPNPWDVIAEKYPVDTIIAGKIKNITDFGVFIGIDEGIDGLVHISDISWTKRIKHPSEVFKKGQEVQAKVLNIDKDNERFSLGIKQLEPDPWQSIPDRYPLGTVIAGPITNVTDFGLFVELEEGIEGLVHVSEISKEKIKSPVGQYKVGDTITAKVINLSPKDRKIGLSMKKVEEHEERSNYHDYVNNAKAATSNLGELLKEEIGGAGADSASSEDA